MPAPSWPRIEGKIPSLSKPTSGEASVWQIPVALISTRTSPAFGPSRSSSTISSGFLASKATAARVFISLLLLRSSAPKIVSFDTRATRFGLLGGFRLVFVRRRTPTRNGIVGARAQIHVDIVDVAHDVHVARERGHHLVVGGIDVLAAVGHDIDEVAVAQRLQ